MDRCHLETVALHLEEKWRMGLHTAVPETELSGESPSNHRMRNVFNNGTDGEAARIV